MFDISEMTDKVKKFFSRLSTADFSIESIQDYIQNHKKQMIIVCIVLVLLMLLFFMLTINSTSNEKKKVSVFAAVAPIDDALILPADPGIREEFQFYHEQRSAWTREDAEKWFTVPDDAMIEDLENTNDKIISDILEAAP